MTISEAKHENFEISRNSAHIFTETNGTKINAVLGQKPKIFRLKIYTVCQALRYGQTF